jgi:hypothetical protein
MAFLGAEKGFQVDGLAAALQVRGEQLHSASLLRDYNQLVSEYNDLMKTMKLWKASADARFRQFEHLQQEAPNAPCLKLTDRKYRDGTAKTVARLVYEQAMREEAKKAGLPAAKVEYFLDT